MKILDAARARLRRIYGAEIAQAVQQNPDLPKDEIEAAVPLYALSETINDLVWDFVNKSEDKEHAMATVIGVLYGALGGLTGRLSLVNDKMRLCAEDAGAALYHRQFNLNGGSDE